MWKEVVLMRRLPLVVLVGCGCVVIYLLVGMMGNAAYAGGMRVQGKQPIGGVVVKGVSEVEKGLRVVGAPTVSAHFIDQVLVAYHSPAAGTGQALYTLGVEYGIDPVIALAFFLHESRFGTQGEARFSRSLGNLRCIAGAVCQDGYAWFPTWQAGYEAWYRLIRQVYVETWGCITVEQIIPRYAPASDGNNEVAYIQAVEQAVQTWRSGQVWVP
jgi:hypothetical protein